MKWILALLFFGCSPDYELTPDYQKSLIGELPPPVEQKWHTDTIVQNDIKEIDVLYVIDNSCSMADEQWLLVDNFPTFIDYFVESNTDFHIGVVSTDMNNHAHAGKLRSFEGEKWIHPGTEDPYFAFSFMARMGVRGSGWERGRDAAWAALTTQAGFNEGFIRDGVSLHIIVISDERDSSYNITVDGFLEYVTKMKAPNDHMTWSSIVPTGEYCSWERAESYLTLSRATMGVIHNICVSEWERVLRELSIKDSGLQLDFNLSRIPIPNTISVKVIADNIVRNPVETSTWAYNSEKNAIIFLPEYTPATLEVVEITYLPDGGY